MRPREKKKLKKSSLIILGEHQVLQRRVQISSSRLLITRRVERVRARASANFGSRGIAVLFSSRMDTADDCTYSDVMSRKCASLGALGLK